MRQPENEIEDASENTESPNMISLSIGRLVSSKHPIFSKLNDSVPEVPITSFARDGNSTNNALQI